MHSDIVWASSIKLEAARSWAVQPGARPQIVIAGVIANHEFKWLRVDIACSLVEVIDIGNNSDPRKFKKAAPAIAEKAERHLEQFVLDARKVAPRRVTGIDHEVPY